jgi:uncharacterized membrane protein SpoIIM required for sporulation
MTSVVWLLVLWSVLTTILVILLIYRSTLTMQEDDQLFLGEGDAHMEREQAALMQKVNRLTPFVRWLGATSAVLILIIAGLAVYDGLARAAMP